MSQPGGGPDPSRPFSADPTAPFGDVSTVPSAYAIPPGDKWRAVKRFRWPALVTGLLLVGASLTYLLIPPTVVGDTAIRVDPADLIAAQQRTAQPMPSLLGLERDIAQTVLADAGLDGVTIEFTEQSAAGPVGLVLGQKPSPGSGDVKEIQLTVSTAAPMPDVKGRSVVDGRKALEQLGAVVEIQRRLDPTVSNGQILETTPPAGDVMPAVVQVAVSDPGDALTLSTIRSVDDDYCSDINAGEMVNGKAVGDSVQCAPGKNPAYVEYAVSRNAAALEAVVGTNDRGGTAGAAVTVLGDGRPLATVSVGLGHSEPIRVDLRDVLRVRIEMTTGDPDHAPKVVLGDARLLGTKEGLDAIASGK